MRSIQPVTNRARGANLSVIGAASLDLDLTAPVEVETWFRGRRQLHSQIRISADNPAALATAVTAQTGP